MEIQIIGNAGEGKTTIARYIKQILSNAGFKTYYTSYEKHSKTPDEKLLLLRNYGNPDITIKEITTTNSRSKNNKYPTQVFE